MRRRSRACVKIPPIPILRAASASTESAPRSRVLVRVLPPAVATAPRRLASAWGWVESLAESPFLPLRREVALVREASAPAPPPYRPRHLRRPRSSAPTVTPRTPQDRSFARAAAPPSSPPRRLIALNAGPPRLPMRVSAPDVARRSHE